MHVTHQASAFATTYGTTLFALRHRARLQPGETLVVLGAAGGCGSAAIELGKWMGARVIAAASTDDKLQVCKELGADDLVNYSSGPSRLKKRLKELGGANVIFDVVGGEYTEAALRSIAWNGRHLVIGFTSGSIPKVALNLALLKNCSIVGVFWGAWRALEPEASDAELKELGELFRQKIIRPRVTRTYSLEEAAQCLEDFANRKVIGKVVLVPSRGTPARL
eukprot:scaffold693_cov399-Prasinococcus_capsulatus_cf.AAC.19